MNGNLNIQVFIHFQLVGKKPKSLKQLINHKINYNNSLLT